MNTSLAIHGGTPVRVKPFPPRRLFDEDSLRAVQEVFEHSWRSGVDFGFQGEFERRYTQAFCDFQGGGYADAVCTGTQAVYLALAALKLSPGAEVVLSPVTDPGAVAPGCLLGYSLAIADAAPQSFNMGAKQMEEVLSPATRAIIVTHLGGIPADMAPIMEIARGRGIAVIEDCSQAHGALYRGARVGTFGDVAAFSTMFSKAHATGGCGGIVYTHEERLYRRVRSLADRGKDFFRPDFNPKDPTQNLFPALNCNLDELSCAIGLTTLRRLPDIIERRLRIIELINAGLAASRVVSPAPIPPDCRISPFFHTLCVDESRITCRAEEFARAVGAEGIPVNPSYKQVTAEWPWLRRYLKREALTPNAIAFRNASFNLLFHERYTDEDAQDIVTAILKVEAAMAKG
ncbi:MAG: DegT/DnrJ/EryC1/StrS aminotransferase family protein [Candidatus Sumerlaeota bacterium]|nr:DegT/DnrJ/EryC1/StrS aminotransferase family protein [Candidatus Sumerlaeota bacterium]